MADVFVSYASADRERARALSQVLTARGWTVWWDRTIPPGRVFDEVIQEEMSAAKCVVVLWSPVSVKSNWVKTEAAEAGGRGILVPALLENVAPPMEFKRIQAANLVGWDGERDHPELATLCAAVDRLVSGPAPAVVVAHRGAPARPGRGRAAVLAGALVALAALIGVGTWLLRRSAVTEPARMAAASNPAPATGTPASTVTAEPPTTAAPAVAAPPATLSAAAHRTNLLSPGNGGQVVAAAAADWAHLIDGDEDQGVWVGGGEGVFAFKDERPARFDTFAVLIPDTNDLNLKTFELLAGDDSPTGPFTSIGKFDTQNMRLFKSPYQEFRFQPVTAKYLKVRSLANQRGDNGAVRAYEFQLFGDLQ